ncbi:MAG: hypothetical protein WAV25_01490 [Minisyncoccia bacterium]
MIYKQLTRFVNFLSEKEAKLVYKKYKPKIVSIVGSNYVAPASYAVFTALSKFYFVRQGGQNPHLSILGFENNQNNFWEWILILTEGLALIILPNHYPEWLIVESKFDGADYFVLVDEQSSLVTKDYGVVYGENSLPKGMTFKILDKNEEYPVYIESTIGEAQIRPILKAFDLCLTLGIQSSVLAKAFSDLHEPNDNYMKLVAGIRGSMIIDDTHDASTESLIDGIKTLGSLDKPKRRIAVLGDILILDRFSIEEHKKVGQEVSDKIDILVTVGIRARNITEEALNNGYPESRAFQFDEAEEAGDFIQNLIREGDVVYASGAMGMHVEKIVEAIKYE